MIIESKVKEFLESKLSVPVLTEVPKNPASSYVIIEKTGDAQEEFINSPILTIQSYGPSLYDAAKLNDEVKRWMLDRVEGLVTLDDITKVKLNSDYNFTDTSKKQYRYQALFEIVHY